MGACRDREHKWPPAIEEYSKYVPLPEGDGFHEPLSLFPSFQVIQTRQYIESMMLNGAG